MVLWQWTCIIKLSDLSDEYEELRQRFGGRALEVLQQGKGGAVDVSKFIKAGKLMKTSLEYMPMILKA